MKTGILLAALLLTANVAFAQTRIDGRVFDPANKPVPGIEVTLHGVGDKSGNEVDQDTTGSDGSFSLNATSPDTSLVYVVAVVWNGQLYIGDLLRAPFPKDQEYVVQVGVNPVNLGNGQAEEAVTSAAPKSKKDRTAGTIVMLVAALVIAAIVTFAIKRRPPARRRWLVELARLEDELSMGSGNAAVLERRRAELRGRLQAPRTG